MKTTYCGVRTGIALLTLTLTLMVLSPAASAASAKLRYGFRPGAVYQVKQLYHDVGKSVVEINMMGQNQTMETPIDQVSQGGWSAKATDKKGGQIILEVDYGTQKGGERWGQQSAASGDIFGGSRAKVFIDPVKGLADIKVEPEDPLTKLIYESRFAWLPELPDGKLKENDGFSYDYVLKSDMITAKVTDDYILEEIKDGLAYFSIESRQVMVIKFSSGPMGGDMPQGMAAMAPTMSDMTIAYKGSGTAIFDIEEGIFIEREMKLSYATKPSAGGAFSTTTQGAIRDRWEMEKR